MIATDAGISDLFMGNPHPSRASRRVGTIVNALANRQIDLEQV
jgi:D-serine deaminase-like pyridoxal phosphate-dependent protein